VAKRVVFLADSISTQKAGIHYYGRQLIDTIMERFPDYDYFSISSAEIPNKGLNQIIVPISMAVPFHLRWRQLLSIPAKARELNPQVVIELAHFGPFNLPKTIRRLTVIHDLSAITHRQYHSTASHLVQKISLAGIIKRSDSIITNSYFTKSEILSRYPMNESKVQVLYPAVHSDSVQHSNHKLFSFTSELYFLCVGTLEPRKNYETVIQAFEQVYDTNPQIHLVIVGMPGWKNDAFDKHYKNSRAQDHIHLTAYVTESQLDQIYQHAFAFISASHFEGFGIPIIEAAKQQLPLIVADNSSQKEIVADKGLLFSSESIEELRSMMDMLIHSPIERERLKLKSKELQESIDRKRKEQLNSLRL